MRQMEPIRNPQELITQYINQERKLRGENMRTRRVRVPRSWEETLDEMTIHHQDLSE